MSVDIVYVRKSKLIRLSKLVCCSSKKLSYDRYKRGHFSNITSELLCSGLIYSIRKTILSKAHTHTHTHKERERENGSDLDRD